MQIPVHVHWRMRALALVVCGPFSASSFATVDFDAARKSVVEGEKALEEKRFANSASGRVLWKTILLRKYAVKPILCKCCNGCQSIIPVFAMAVLGLAENLPEKRELEACQKHKDMKEKLRELYGRCARC